MGQLWNRWRKAYPGKCVNLKRDDHNLFFVLGVPILHLIVTPFPSVWHKMGDNANAIDWDDTEDLNKILRVFVAEYLQVCWIWDEILDGITPQAS